MSTHGAGNQTGSPALMDAILLQFRPFFFMPPEMFSGYYQTKTPVVLTHTRASDRRCHFTCKGGPLRSSNPTRNQKRRMCDSGDIVPVSKARTQIAICGHYTKKRVVRRDEFSSRRPQFIEIAAKGKKLCVRESTRTGYEHARGSEKGSRKTE